MNARELFALSPYGATVRFSNGQPKPPARFNKKLREWESHNSAGRFVRAEQADPSAQYSREGFVLQTRHAIIIMQMCFGLEGSNTFEIEQTPPPGTILAFTKFGRDLELQAVCLTEGEARKWWDRNRHSTSRILEIVAENGERLPFTLSEPGEPFGITGEHAGEAMRLLASAGAS